MRPDQCHGNASFAKQEEQDETWGLPYFVFEMTADCFHALQQTDADHVGGFSGMYETYILPAAKKLDAYWKNACATSRDEAGTFYDTSISYSRWVQHAIINKHDGPPEVGPSLLSEDTPDTATLRVWAEHEGGDPSTVIDEITHVATEYSLHPSTYPAGGGRYIDPIKRLEILEARLDLATKMLENAEIGVGAHHTTGTTYSDFMKDRSCHVVEPGDYKVTHTVSTYDGPHGVEQRITITKRTLLMDVINALDIPWDSHKSVKITEAPALHHVVL